MLSLANQGYRPAETTIQAFLAAGNHPSAGAQNAGGVPDGMVSTVYDSFVANYAGPLSPAAASAVANRRAYLAWVQRIAAWPGAGSRRPAAGPGGVPGAGHAHDLGDIPGRGELIGLLASASPPRHGTGPLTPGRFRVVCTC